MSKDEAIAAIAAANLQMCVQVMMQVLSLIQDSSAPVRIRCWHLTTDVVPQVDIHAADLESYQILSDLLSEGYSLREDEENICSLGDHGTELCFREIGFCPIRLSVVTFKHTGGDV